MKTTRILSIVIFVMVLAHSASADDRLGMRSMGMGRAAVAASRGIDAIGVNPANIAIQDVGHFNLSLIQSSFRVSTELFTYDIYQKYFTGKDSVDAQGKKSRVQYPLTDQDKADIRSQLPDNPVTRMNLELMDAGFSLETSVLGGIGFAIIEHAGIRMDFSRDYFEFFLQGLPSSTTYTFNGTSFEAWWYREYNFSYGRKLPVSIPFLKNLYVGAGVKLIQGFGIFETTKNNASIENKSALNDTSTASIIGKFDFAGERAGVDFFNNDSTTISPKPFPTPVGRGTGFDIGVSAEFFNGLRMGISVTDIGKITWDKNIIQTTGGGQITFTGYTAAIQDSVKHILKGKNSPGEGFSTSLPTIVHVGVTAQSDELPFLRFLPGRLLLAAEYAQGLNESLGNTTKPRVSLGAEYRIIPLLPLRSGLLVGGGDQLRWAFGFGFDFRYLSLDFATDNFGMFFTPKSFQVFSISMGLRIRV